jgi:hypothetical protein
VSGFRYTLADTTGHVATPVSGSYTMERGGAPARLLYAEDYPVIAVCKLDHKLQMEWRHVPAPAAGSAS